MSPCMMLPSSDSYHQHKSNQLLIILMKHISDEDLNLNHIVPLHTAVRREHLATFFFRLITAFLEFSSKGHNTKIWNLIKKILKFCPECARIKDEFGYSLLHKILRGDYFYDINTIQYLLKAAPDHVKEIISMEESASTTSFNFTIVHYLLLNGTHSYHYDLVEQVIRACPQVARSHDCHGHLPIHILFNNIPSHSHRGKSFYMIIELLLESNPYSAYDEIYQEKVEYTINSENHYNEPTTTATTQEDDDSLTITTVEQGDTNVAIVLQYLNDDEDNEHTNDDEFNYNNISSYHSIVLTTPATTNTNDYDYDNALELTAATAAGDVNNIDVLAHNTNRSSGDNTISSNLTIVRQSSISTTNPTTTTTTTTTHTADRVAVVSVVDINIPTTVIVQPITLLLPLQQHLQVNDTSSSSDAATNNATATAMVIAKRINIKWCSYGKSKDLGDDMVGSSSYR